MDGRHHRSDVIIVDPTPRDYHELLQVCHSQRLVVATFTSAAEALERARPRRDSLWLVNSRLPDVSALELAAALRGRSWQALFLVGDVYSPAEEVVARLAGVTAYVCKPPRSEWLAAWLGQRNAAAIRAGPCADRLAATSTCPRRFR